ncbi:MAG: threonine--tRNA ligase [Candidatus Gastranaerophilales bacterium]|nr:threonine--tRNA ligase [Candidatus Gastranaerophilales bacterium]
MSEIHIILPDESKLALEPNSTALDAAKKISEGLARNALACKINDVVCSLDTVLTDNDRVAILTAKDPESLDVLRHSCSHIMAQAVQALYPEAKLAIGPAIENGFYYDFDIPGVSLKEEDLGKIEAKMQELIAQDLVFKKVVIDNPDEKIKEFLAQGEIYKAELLEEHKSENPTLFVTKTKEGKELWNDLCRGPHLLSSKPVKAFKLLSVAGAYWRGNEKNKMLQRVYATAFLTKDDLKAYLTQLEEAERRDHRKLGSALDLFSIEDEVGSGLVLWHPNLSIVREEIENYWRSEHRKRDYVIVNTPHIAKPDLWITSGHMDYYSENMFMVKSPDQDFVLKPMNCPFHMLIYKSDRQSYRSLPLRLAELGTVYRNERSGALSGMTRVRGFTQDDAHIFCTHEQFIDEVIGVIDFVDYTLSLFNIDYSVELSTRPEKFVGTNVNWDKAEEGLKQALEKKGLKYDINEGDGAFYGPKIDFKLKDAIGRTWQGATVQLDFTLPERFDLKYQDKDGSLKTPVMLHRVIFGSMERFAGLLIEHYAGAFPTWLAPVQVEIIPIADRHVGAAEAVYKSLRAQGIRAKLDDRSESMNYKIREAQNKKIPYMAVIGDKEIEDKTLSVRASKGRGQIGTMSVDEFIAKINEEITSKGKVELV